MTSAVTCLNNLDTLFYIMCRNGTKQTSDCNCFCDRPTPDISWQKDGAELPSSRMSVQNFQKTLKISDVNEGDAGDYHCTASNKLGNTHHVIKVTVKGMQFSCFTLGPSLCEQFLFIVTSELYINVSSVVNEFKVDKI